MSVPTISWDETSPAGSDAMSTVDNRLREFKTQVREVIGVDHDFPSSGQDTDVGQHLQVTLQEQADLGTGAVNATILGSQTVSGKGELVYTDEDDNDIQITKAGVLKPSTSTVLADWSAIMNLVYPVGAVVTLGVSTNPATLFGVGTWTAIEGRVIVGKASAGTFNTLDATGGAETHTLTTDEIPAHTHTYGIADVGAAGAAVDSGDGGTSNTTGSTGGGSAHNNLQPYIVKYVWQRTA